MTAISFSVFKDSLLSGEKRQTIRKPRKNPIKVGGKLQIYWKQRQRKIYHHHCPSCGSFEGGWVEEKVAVCEKCCSPCLICCDGSIDDHHQVDGSEKLFDAVCTNTWLIEMQYNPHKEGGYLIKWGSLYFTEKSKEIEDLAKSDGFESEWNGDYYEETNKPNLKMVQAGISCKKTAAQKMFEWFDEHYYLSEPKVFQVIRWEKEAQK